MCSRPKPSSSVSSVDVPAKKSRPARRTPVPALGGLPAGGPATVQVLVAPSKPSADVVAAADHDPRVVDERADAAAAGSVTYAIDISTCLPAYADRSNAAASSRRSSR